MKQIEEKIVKMAYEKPAIYVAGWVGACPHEKRTEECPMSNLTVEEVMEMDREKLTSLVDYHFNKCANREE